MGINKDSTKNDLFHIRCSCTHKLTLLFGLSFSLCQIFAELKFTWMARVLVSDPKWCWEKKTPKTIINKSHHCLSISLNLHTKISQCILRCIIFIRWNIRFSITKICYQSKQTRWIVQQFKYISIGKTVWHRNEHPQQDQSNTVKWQWQW